MEVPSWLQRVGILTRVWTFQAGMKRGRSPPESKSFRELPHGWAALAPAGWLLSLL